MRAVLLLGLLPACVPSGDAPRAPAAGGSPSTTVAASRPPLRPAPVLSSDDTAQQVEAHHPWVMPDTVVHPAEIPADVSVACDTAVAIVHRVRGLEMKRQQGNYEDSFGTPRTGCRLTTWGSFKALKDREAPMDGVEASFARLGWRHDGSHDSDGPDGSSIGLRHREMLCVVAGSWDGGDDSEPDTLPPSEAPDAEYGLTIECARVPVDNARSDVPRIIWNIATRAGMDSVYAISRSRRIPPYEEGDFDGDGVKDAAVLIERRKTGQIGFAIIHRGTGLVTILGAGSGSAGPADLDWVEEWEPYTPGTINVTIHDAPRTQSTADALWVARNDSTTGFYVWTGKTFVYEPHHP